MPNFSPTIASSSDYLPGVTTAVAPATDFSRKVSDLHAEITNKGFCFEPWQVAAFVTAIRSKPFVIIAGISGTGKTKIPRLVAQGSGSNVQIVPVHPDWTDGSELIGYTDLNGSFVPGKMLRAAKTALTDTEKHYFFVLDELNLSRPEYYLADYLSHLEERYRNNDGVAMSAPLQAGTAVDASGEDWGNVSLPNNFCVVGTVNMDETTHGFSRKVLDRAFVLELANVDLTWVVKAKEVAEPLPWAVTDLQQRWLTLAEANISDPNVTFAIDFLSRANEILQAAQIHVGYRVRDEVCFFLLNAQDCLEMFKTADEEPVDPLDVAILMKILPRLQGGSSMIGNVLDELAALFDDIDGEGRNLPMSREKIDVMIQRLEVEGFASYWL